VDHPLDDLPLLDNGPVATHRYGYKLRCFLDFFKFSKNYAKNYKKNVDQQYGEF